MISINASGWIQNTAYGPKGSILGQLLFNIYLSDFFLFVSPNIANYIDDNSPYVTSTDTESVMNQENEAKSLQWHQNNAFKTNPGKSNLQLNSTDNSLICFYWLSQD